MDRTIIAVVFVFLEAASAEILAVLGTNDANGELVGRLVGRKEEAPRLSDEELLKLKALLNSI